MKQKEKRKYETEWKKENMKQKKENMKQNAYRIFNIQIKKTIIFLLE